MATGKGIRMTHEIIKGAFLGKVGDYFKSIVNNDAVKNLAIKVATAVAKKVANKLKINPIHSFIQVHKKHMHMQK